MAPNVPGAPYKILSFRKGKGWVISGDRPEKDDTKVFEQLDEPDTLAASTLGRLAKNPRVATLRRFITDWYVSYLSVDHARGLPEAGAQERLSRTGDNLANVVQFLNERHKKRLKSIFTTLQRRVPRLKEILSEPTADGRLLLRIQDAPFDQPVLARFASDGTLKMLAYLVVLYDPNPPPFIGIEEPENFLHPPASSRTRGGVPCRLRAFAAPRHHALAVFRQRAASERGACALPRQGGIHAGRTRVRHPRRFRSSSKQAPCSAIFGSRVTSASEIPLVRSGSPRAAQAHAMTVTHVEVLVEEPSMEAALNVLLPKLIGSRSFAVHVHNGKANLLKRIERRGCEGTRRGYRTITASSSWWIGTTKVAPS